MLDLLLIVDTIGSVDDLIEKHEEAGMKILNFLSLQYQYLMNNNQVFKLPLTDFSYYQEGPGIRNWQYVNDNGVKFINIRCINDNDLNLTDANMISKEEAFGIYKHFLVNYMDILVSTSGTLGRLAIARHSHLPLCMNTSVIRFKPKITENYPLLFCYLMSSNFKNALETMANGSAQLNFGPTHIKKLNIDLPCDEVLANFNEQNYPLILNYISLLNKIDQLKLIKNLLLQKYFG